MSLRKAINGKCKDCIYDPLAGGTWLAQVAQCSCIDCPLWPVRPAPKDGSFSNPPRDRARVPSEWLAKPNGEAKSALSQSE